MGLLWRDANITTATIASGQPNSDAIRNDRSAMGGLALPAAFTGSSLSFLVSTAKGGTYQALYDETGVLVTIASVTQGRSYTLPAALAPWPWFKIVSGSNEGADRSIPVSKKG
jgi:hypothetical protein